MSGSKDKKLRKSQREAGIDFRSRQDVEQEQKNKKQQRSILIGGIIFAIFAVIVLAVNSNAFYRNASAVKISDEGFSITELNYQYYSYYYNFLNNYGSYNLIDTSTPLKNQEYEEGKSWADYILEQAVSNLENLKMIHDQAAAAGMTLSDEKKAEVNEILAGLETLPEGYTSVNHYLSASYGKGMTKTVYQGLLEYYYLAQQYEEYKSQELKDSYSDQELEAYYQEKRDEYDVLNYRQYLVAAKADEEADIDAETAMAAAKETAEEMLSQTTGEESFNQVVRAFAPEEEQELYAEDDSTLNQTRGASLAGNVAYDWLISPDRVAGDMTVIESEGEGYYVIYFVNRDDNHKNTAQARHILISPSETDEETGEYTEEAWAEALTAIEDIYTQWKEGEADEDSFADLAKTNSSDTGSAANGGLYEAIYEGQMVEAFNDWVFDPARQSGDTEIVKTEYGYHLIYFVSAEGPLYSNYLAQQSKLNEDYTAWSEGLKNEYQASLTILSRFVG